MVVSTMSSSRRSRKKGSPPPSSSTTRVFGWSFRIGEINIPTPKAAAWTSGFSAASEHRPAGTLAVLYSTDLEAARDRTIKAGGKIVRDIFSFPGGRRFEFTDPAGNRLGVWSDK
jgi:predicted enzyme related to lactoylglutathione lyase